jgi:predicted phosphodiesterase
VGTLRRRLAILAVVVATIAGGLATMALYSDAKDLSVGSVDVSVSPFHDGALDVYVPVVDWGARFPAVRFPARLKVDVRAVDRDEVRRLATGGLIDAGRVRHEASDAIAAYIRVLLLLILLGALAAGAVATFVVRGGASPRKRVLLTIAGATALAFTVLTAITLPPRGAIDKPQYYAFGADVPRALEALQNVRQSSSRLDQELNAQLLGLARLVEDPGRRPDADAAPHFTIASDLHNNFLTIPILERTADKGPVLFPGDLTDRGSPLETALIKRIVRTGRPFVFVAGNHDSDTLVRELQDDGAIVLDHTVKTIAGVRIAGYGSPFLRLASDDYKDHYPKQVSDEDKEAFAQWLRPLVGHVDIVMVHDEKVAETGIKELEAIPPEQPIVFVVGHTHHAHVRETDTVTVIDDGSIGGGGSGNLTESTPVALAQFAYETRPFRPLAVDLVSIDPGDGSATASRTRVDD